MLVINAVAVVSGEYVSRAPSPGVATPGLGALRERLFGLRYFVFAGVGRFLLATAKIIVTDGHRQGIGHVGWLGNLRQSEFAADGRLHLLLRCPTSAG